MANSDASSLHTEQGCHGQGKVREKQKFFIVRVKSRNFLKGPGKSLILAKSVERQGIPFSGLQLISFLHDFSIHFLLKKTKCILQSKETDQFHTQRLTHVVVLIIGFVEKKKPEWIC